MGKFIGKPLRGVEVGEGGVPLSFRWKGREFRIDQILRQWQDFDYSPLSPRKDWRSRRHRNYYRVMTERGKVFELYCDRGTHLGSTRTWVLAQELEGDENAF